MKCPKCGYIGFEATDRCKNCGYEFALASVTPAGPDLSMRPDDQGGPLSDLSLKAGAAAATPVQGGRARLDLDRVIGEQPADGDLPLFGGAQPDQPMVTPSAAPRRPLAVRRATPEPARIRRGRGDDPRPPAATLNLPLAEAPEPHPEHAAGSARPGGPAEPLPRLAAALVDVALLGAVDLVTIYFTLRVCDLQPAEWRVLPVLPLAAFFLIVNGGYLVTFTAAGGQTIGKMAFGLKVVGYGDLPVSIGLSAVRAAGAIGSTVCLGLGLLPALLKGGGRALHDRMADTHVVRVDA